MRNKDIIPINHLTMGLLFSEGQWLDQHSTLMSQSWNIILCHMVSAAVFIQIIALGKTRFDPLIHQIKVTHPQLWHLWAWALPQLMAIQQKQLVTFELNLVVICPAIWSGQFAGVTLTNETKLSSNYLVFESLHCL